MHQFSEKRILPFSDRQLFDLVSDVAKYPEFLPWCMGARIYNQKSGQFDADVIIGFKMFRERFTSRVSVEANSRVDVDYIKGPMKRLYNHWRFVPQADGTCLVDFEVDFEFKSRVLNQMIGALFAEACKRMMSAFEERAQALYGDADQPS
ncbi:MAG: type II toxin-antitoxin system RatA family toxin [Alphaproteobacteria bacterium]|nr:type II toxin-antitoxin system RatA family toxin [Alphaproteobacteria bacterium]